MEDSISLKVAMPHRQTESGYGRARLDSVSRRKLGLEIGDAVEITGKRTVVAKVFPSPIEDEGHGLIGIDGLMRTNAGVSIDENVTVRKCHPAEAEKVTLAPNIPDGKKIRYGKDAADVFSKDLQGRPLMAGTDIIIPNFALMGNRSTFNVVSTVPKGPVMVTGRTQILLKDSSQKQTVKSNVGKQITYDDVGGLDDELRRIREMIELPLKHPELFERLGIGAPKGVLLYGPPGTGKTLIAEAVANESGATLFSVRGPEIIGQYYGQSEERLRDIFKQASESTPSIIFLDEIDSIAPNRDSVSGEVERRVVAQLLTLMDGLGDRGNIIVVAATNREDSVDPALRRPGRFDREIEIGIPGRKARMDILDVHMRGMPLTEDVSVETLAGMTQGFVGADLAALCREAAMKCVRSRFKDIDLDKPIPSSMLEDMKVSMMDFKDALADVEPSGMREVLVEIPKVTWDDVGGLEDVRRQIEEALVPEEGNDAYERLGIEPAKGVLLYGPPGTGKTLIAKAIANETGANFISVNGPEMASKWLGESERAIRQIFKRAKQMSPCIIFFDELDSIAPIRGGDGGSSWERVVAQLLTSMDGVESLTNVMVMAATNRPDMIDPALLRPGRFDKLILVGKPNEASRLNILKVHTRKMPLKDVDLASIASRTDGFVGADLAALCREAGLTAYREDHGARFVTMDHFEEALLHVFPSVDSHMLDNYDRIEKDIKKRRSGWDNVPFYNRSEILLHVWQCLAEPQ
jgi:transitional endoplasmic reticulum ATPase